MGGSITVTLFLTPPRTANDACTTYTTLLVSPTTSAMPLVNSAHTVNTASNRRVGELTASMQLPHEPSRQILCNSATVESRTRTRHHHGGDYNSCNGANTKVYDVDGVFGPLDTVHDAKNARVQDMRENESRISFTVFEEKAPNSTQSNRSSNIIAADSIFAILCVQSSPTIFTGFGVCPLPTSG